MTLPRNTLSREQQPLIKEGIELTHAGKLAFAHFHDIETAKHKASVNALVERMAELERQK